jgi:hypothetical protein
MILQHLDFPHKLNKLGLTVSVVSLLLALSTEVGAKYNPPPDQKPPSNPTITTTAHNYSKYSTVG